MSMEVTWKVQGASKVGAPSASVGGAAGGNKGPGLSYLVLYCQK